MFFILFYFFGFTQQTITLTFTAIDSTSYVQLDSIKVMNRTQDCDTVLYWSDTVLALNVPVAVPDIKSRIERLEMQCFPNPVIDESNIELTLPEKGLTYLTVTDVLGKTLYVLERELTAGSHDFMFTPGSSSLYFITVAWNGYHRSIKLVNSTQNKSLQCNISYEGYDAAPAAEKASEALQGFTFELGDELLYVGYVNELESGLLNIPDTSQLYTFQFAYDIPCIGTPTVNYEGQIYNTVQVFSQCWLKENLNVGTMILGDSNMIDNGIVEKYCYDNQLDSCVKNGGLYQWNEMMQYTTQQGTQGICPPGWHLPTDEEWKVLEGSVDSQYGIGNNTWDDGGYRGYDAGTNLKTTSGWHGNGNGTDLFGFSGLPCGRRDFNGPFYNIGSFSNWWSSSENISSHAWIRNLSCNLLKVRRDVMNKKNGYSVRCIRDIDKR
jgi:uncharacterized protein (TIGR02145 family)